MKKFFMMLILSNALLFGANLAWEEDFSTAIAKAKKEHKNIMVMVQAAYCKWCIKMKEETLSNPKIIKRLQNYVLVELDRDDEEEMKVLPKEHYPAPTIFFMTPNKETLERVIGYFDAEDFLSYINDVEEN